MSAKVFPAIIEFHVDPTTTTYMWRDSYTASLFLNHLSWIIALTNHSTKDSIENEDTYNRIFDQTVNVCFRIETCKPQVPLVSSALSLSLSACLELTHDVIQRQRKLEW